MEKRIRQLQPYLLLALISFLFVLPQIMNHAAFIGVDSIFHMNRFYDTSMQIKTGHFNYFQSFFGFMGSGRIVNPLYGPLFAYLNGFILLISGNWINYQIVDSFLILFTSSALMYHLAIRFRIPKFDSVIIGIMYSLSTPILNWVVGQQFTGWGAALLPVLLVNAADLINGRIKPIKLSIGVVILLQVHVLSCLIGCLALLPFWIIGFYYSSERKQIIKNSRKAVLWTILLSANVWSGMLEVMLSNHLLPVAPATPLSVDTLRIFGNNSSVVLNPFVLALFALILLYTVCFWKDSDYDFKVITLTGFGFLFISSWLFPWNLIGRVLPFLNFYLQMPKRLAVVAYILLLLSGGLILRDHTEFMIVDRFKRLIGIFLILLMVFSFGLTVNDGIKGWKSFEGVQNDNNVMFHIHHVEKLRHDLNSDNLQKALFDITKSTPDYLPISHSLSTKQYYPFRPYHTYGDQIIYNSFNVHPKSHQLKRTVKADGIHFEWVNNGGQNQKINLPLIKYSHSRVLLNGKVLKHVETSKIGRISVDAKPGKNVVIMNYHSSWWFKVITIVSILGWLLVILKSIIVKIKD